MNRLVGSIRICLYLILELFLRKRLPRRSDGLIKVKALDFLTGRRWITDSHWLDPGGPEQPTPFICGTHAGRVQPKQATAVGPERPVNYKYPALPPVDPSSSPGLSHSDSEDPTPDPTDGFGRETLQRGPRLLAVAARILFHHLPSFFDCSHSPVMQLFHVHY